MKLVACAIFDNAVSAFSRPMFVPHTGFAVRSFQNEVKNAQSDLAKNKGDYVLFEVGRFDEETGSFENVVPPKMLVRAADLGEPGE